MPLIRLDKVSITFGDKPLLHEVDFQIDPGERVALVGLNGAGKSTMLRLIAGQHHPDSGEFWVSPTCHIADLPQSMPNADERRVVDVVTAGLAEIQLMREQYDKLASAGAEADLRALETLQHQLEAVDGWHLEQRVQRIIEQLQLPGDKRMSELSGGWRRRVALGAALVQNPNLLLLDEPTNHLDIETIEWLEQQLLEFKGGLLIISHDRALVDRLATRIVELDRGVLSSFPGSYESYLQRKEKMLEDEAKQNSEFDKKLAQEESWIRQGIKARRTRNEGRVRALKAMRQERAGRLERQGKARFSLDEAVRSGKLVAELTDVSLGYEGRTLFHNLDFLLQRGDRVGLIGPNGAGKSSLLNVILGRQQPDSGEVRLGSNLKVAYFDQLRAQLDPEKSVMDNIAEGRESITLNGRSRHLISYLSDFMFAPERARTPVKALSGGETNRVLLAKLFSQPANLLVLDEPTNDLDIETLELLEEIILDFDGTLLLVSHDRTFLDNVVTSTLVFDQPGEVNEYVGGYQDWLRQRPETMKPEPAAKAKVSADTVTQPAAVKASRKKLSYKLQRELDSLPEQIEQVETELEALQQETGDSAFYQQDTETVTQRLQLLQEKEIELEQLMERWVELEALQQGD